MLIVMPTRPVMPIRLNSEGQQHDGSYASVSTYLSYCLGESTGTAFAIDRDARQYLVTARHVVKGIKSGDEIAISYKQEWHKIAVDVVGAGKDAIDVTVLACPQLLAPPKLTLTASLGGVRYGQEVKFLGFPFGWDSTAKGPYGDFPLPFVKAGVVSAIATDPCRSVYIDGHGNKGIQRGSRCIRLG